MGEYAFYEYRGDAERPPGAQLLPLPVRAEMEAQVFGGAEVRVDLLPEELAAFLSEHPELAARYRSTVGNLAWMAGVREGTQGDTEAAARHLKMGVQADPGNVLLRSNYALALHLQKRKGEALQQYETVLAAPEGPQNPMVSLLAARLYAEDGRFLEAYDLLRPLGGELFTDEAYQTMLGEMKELAGAVDQEEKVDTAEQAEAALAPPLGGGFCTQCGNRIQEGYAFCDNCGYAAEWPVTEPPVTEPPAKKRAFCTNCGAPLTGDHLYCDQCGKKI
jgi:tetratricopeptide (TPR) repeat protein